MSTFASHSVKNSIIQQFEAPIDRVFPLLCPVREYEWIEPWKCEMLHSDSGIAEKCCVFRTGVFDESSKIGLPGEPSSDIWVISRYEPNSRIEFVRMNALRISFLSYSLSDNGDGTTRSVCERLLVGLTEQGNQSLNGIAEKFAFEFSIGGAMLNHYLTTGKMLPMQDAVAMVLEQ